MALECRFRKAKSFRCLCARAACCPPYVCLIWYLVCPLSLPCPIPVNSFQFCCFSFFFLFSRSWTCFRLDLYDSLPMHKCVLTICGPISYFDGIFYKMFKWHVTARVNIKFFRSWGALVRKQVYGGHTIDNADHDQRKQRRETGANIIYRPPVFRNWWECS